MKPVTAFLMAAATLVTRGVTGEMSSTPTSLPTSVPLPHLAVTIDLPSTTMPANFTRVIAESYGIEKAVCTPYCVALNSQDECTDVQGCGNGAVIPPEGTASPQLLSGTHKLLVLVEGFALGFILRELLA